MALVIGLVLGVALLGLWWGLDRTGHTRVAPVGPPEPLRAPTSALAAGPRTTVEKPKTAPPSPPPPALPAPLPPVIDEITVEKPEVCEGEENLVTVRAHTTDGNDAFLHYQIGPTRGASVAVRAFLDDAGTPTVEQVRVFSKHNVVTVLPVPPYRVKRCEDLPVAIIGYRLLPNTWADFEFEGRVATAVPSRAITSPAAPFRPRSYTWYFGTDSAGEGGSPRVSHSFAARPEDTLYSSVLVSLEITAEDGRVARARQAIELRNPAFEAFATKKIVQLLVELDPRFPVLAEDGRVDQGVRLWHVRSEPVEIATVIRVRRRLGGSGAREVVPVASVLGGTLIPPGRGLTTHVILDTAGAPDVLAEDYFLEGRTPEGYAVRGSFSVMRPPARPSAEHHQPIRDPRLLAKVRRARELLGKAFVTDEDLWALERAGRFSDLQVDPDAPGNGAGDSATPAPGR